MLCYTVNMKATFYHPSINVTDVNFYEDLLTYLGFNKVAGFRNGIGMSDGTVSVWVFKVAKRFSKNSFHRKNVGLNHLAFRVDSSADVDLFYTDYILKNNIPVLYGGPKEYPQYEPGYYAVYFEDPDRLKLEVMYNP